MQFTATPPVAFAWFKDATLLEGQTNAQLQLPSLTRTDAGRYSVQISDAAGSVSSNPIDLEVLPLPTLLRFTGPTRATVGASALFEVQFTATPPVAIAWFKDATLLEGQTNAQLQLPSLTPTDAGRYRAVITDSVGETRSEAIPLSVIELPQIHQPPKSQTVQSGSTLMLSIGAHGTELLQYQWFHEGTALTTATNAQLEIQRIQPEQSGRYWVVVKNEAGVSVSSEAIIQVMDPPVILRPLGAQVVWAGDWVEWTLEYAGSEPITIEWRHNGELLAGETSRQLRFQAQSPSQAGNYSAILRNALTSSPIESTALSILFPAAIRFDAGTGEVVLTQPARAGEDYVLESAEHLEAPWIETYRGKAAVNGVEVRHATGEGSRFYRLRFAPPTP